MKRLLALALVFLGAGGASAQVRPWDQPTLTSAPAALYAAKKGQEDVGALTYAGGLYLVSGSSRFGGLSGLEARDDGDGTVAFYAVTDAGDFVQFTGVLDDAGRLVRAEDLRLSQLVDEEGVPLQGKPMADAEDLSLLTDRPGFLVSFERTPRIVAYEDPTRADAAQVRVEIAAPVRKLRGNRGLEAIAALPGGVVAEGVEDGRVFLCPRGDEACTQILDKAGIGLDPTFGLSAMDHLADGELVAIYRQRTLLAHWNAKIVHIRMVEGKAQVSVLADLKAFLGNMEGIAAVPLPDGKGWRLYLSSDNGFDAREPTLLLAFDWRP